MLGFCNEDGSGAYGLEKYYDETLAGTPGRSVAETAPTVTRWPAVRPTCMKPSTAAT